MHTFKALLFTGLALIGACGALYPYGILQNGVNLANHDTNQTKLLTILDDYLSYVLNRYAYSKNLKADNELLVQELVPLIGSYKENALLPVTDTTVTPTASMSSHQIIKQLKSQNDYLYDEIFYGFLIKGLENLVEDLKANRDPFPGGIIPVDLDEYSLYQLLKAERIAIIFS